MGNYHIKATVGYIERAKIKPPNDGVHVAGKEGFIKGVHSLWFDEDGIEPLLISKGQVAFYYRRSADIGLKVFYSFGWWKAQKEKYVRKIFKKHYKIWKLGLAPKPHEIKRVKLELDYPREKKKIRTKAWAYTVDHVHYPEKEWELYAKGYPYEFVDYPKHNPDEFLKFVEMANQRLNAAKIKIHGSFKLGDVCYCTEKNRWYLVDIDD